VHSDLLTAQFSSRYTTSPLYIIQELMLGKAVDKQLYVEHWQPTAQQVRN